LLETFITMASLLTNYFVLKLIVEKGKIIPSPLPPPRVEVIVVRVAPGAVTPVPLPYNVPLGTNEISVTI
jgi:hypothetical protein